jgi:uncharacterized protein YegL
MFRRRRRVVTGFEPEASTSHPDLDRGYGATGERVLPVYLVCEESHVMAASGGIAQINGLLSDLHNEMAGDPVVSYLVKVGVITFADSSEELLPLEHLHNVGNTPQLFVEGRGPSKLSDVLDFLKTTITRDISDLKDHGTEVFRPIVIFLTLGGIDESDSEWNSAFNALTDQSTFPHWPRVIALGLSGALEDSIQKLGAVASYITDQDAIADIDVSGILNFYFCVEGVVHASTLDGRKSLENAVPPAPEGFRQVSPTRFPIQQLDGSPRERPVIPMRRNFSELRGSQVFPFYIVCDESAAMKPIGGIAAMNQALPDIHAEIASNPLLSEKCLISLITFAETAEELMQLTKLSDVVAMPGLQARGPGQYGPVFTLLREIIHRDVENLMFFGVEVFRSTVFIMTACEPTDDQEWEDSYRALVNKETFRHYPNIIVFGVHGASASTIDKIGTIGSFIGENSVTPIDALATFTKSILNI